MDTQIIIDYRAFIKLQDEIQRLNKIIENEMGMSKVKVRYTINGDMIREHYYTKDIYLLEINEELNQLREYKNLPWYKKIFN